MRAKTIFIIILSVLVTIVVMQNADEVWFSIFFWNLRVSKLIVMAALALVGFLAGYLAGRRRKKPYETATGYDTAGTDVVPDNLSKEDRDYIN